MTNRSLIVEVVMAGDAVVADFASRFVESLSGAPPARLVSATAITDLYETGRTADIIVFASSVNSGELHADLSALLDLHTGERPLAGTAFALGVGEPADSPTVETRLKPALAGLGLTCPSPGLYLPPRQDCAPAIEAYCRYWRLAVPTLVEWTRTARVVAT